MAMMCGEILSLPSLREMKVVAGANGLNRPLRWIYIAECLEDMRQIVNWIYGGELVFVSGLNVKGDPGQLLDVVRMLIDKKAAGMVVYIGPYIREVPKAVLEEAEAHAFPLFELPWEARLVTVSQDICQALTMKEMEEKTLDNLLVSILFGERTLEAHIQTRAEYYGYLPDKPARICIADINAFSDYLKQHGIIDETAIVELKLFIKRTIQNAIVDRGKAPILMLRSDSFICLVQTRNETAEAFITSLFDEVQREVDRHYPGLALRLGIGNAYLSLDEMHESLNEAELALKAGKCRLIKSTYNFYSDMGIFSILFAVRDKRVLENYYTATLSKVIEYDRLNNATLLHTLEIFLESGGNLADISDKLFIHKNTLKYRIMKIEEITGLSVKNISDCTRLEVALMIGRLLEAERR